MYLKDKSLAASLRILPKLTDAHMYPNCFQKMNVRLAVQLLSKSVANGIKYFRTVNVETMDEFRGKFKWKSSISLNISINCVALTKGSAQTEEMIRILDSVFDIMNGRWSKEAINHDNWPQKRQVF
jgi:hypothetical protein